MTEDETASAGCKQTLCQKYGITDQQLDFEYIGKCKNPAELERILKILRSNEVGHFEKLEEHAERRLRELAPNSRALLTPQPVSSWNELNAEDRDVLARDYLNWRTSENDPAYQELRKEAEETPRNFPAIRNSDKTTFSFKETEVKNEKSPKSCVPRSYESWSQFNVEKELSLIDREDELKLNSVIRADNEAKALQSVSDEASGLLEVGAGDAHRRDAAHSERLKGNDFYREKDYYKAIEYYTRSISFSRNAESFNNRAQCYIHLSKYREALSDCREALQLSPDNPKVVSKAHYRRSTAYMRMGRDQEAYEEILNALKADPNDKEIQERASKLEENRGTHSISKKVRMVIQEKESGRSNALIEEITTKDVYYPFMNSWDSAPQSDIGTARNMCRCSGVPPFIAKLRSAENQPMNNRLCLRKIRPKKPFNEKKWQSHVEKASGFMNGEIIEKDTIEDVEKVVMNEEMNKILTLKSNLISSLERGDLESVVEEVATLHPSHVCEALSGRLDANTLNLCIKALCVHLKDPSMWKTVEEHLLALAQLPQFRSSLKCLEKATKDGLSERIASVEEVGQRVSHVVTLYELNGALPPPQ